MLASRSTPRVPRRAPQVIKYREYNYMFISAKGRRMLFCENLGRGADNNAQLVNDADTGELIVRRVGRARQRRNPIYDGEKCVPLLPSYLSTLREIRLRANRDLFLQPYGPYLAEFLSHEYIQGAAEDGTPRFTSVSYWKFYNGGAVDEAVFRNDKNRLVLPVAAVARLLWQVLQTLHYMYKIGPKPVYHGDIHLGNVLMHWPKDSDDILPHFYLADFDNLVDNRPDNAPSRDAKSPVWELVRFANELDNVIYITRPDFAKFRDGDSHGDYAGHHLALLRAQLAKLIRDSANAAITPDLDCIINSARGLEMSIKQGWIDDILANEHMYKLDQFKRKVLENCALRSPKSFLGNGEEDRDPPAVEGPFFYVEKSGNQWVSRHHPPRPLDSALNPESVSVPDDYIDEVTLVKNSRHIVLVVPAGREKTLLVPEGLSEKHLDSGPSEAEDSPASRYMHETLPQTTPVHLNQPDNRVYFPFGAFGADGSAPADIVAPGFAWCIIEDNSRIQIEGNVRYQDVPRRFLDLRFQGLPFEFESVNAWYEAEEAAWDWAERYHLYDRQCPDRRVYSDSAHYLSQRVVAVPAYPLAREGREVLFENLGKNVPIYLATPEGDEWDEYIGNGIYIDPTWLEEFLCNVNIPRLSEEQQAELDRLRELDPSKWARSLIHSAGEDLIRFWTMAWSAHLKHHSGCNDGDRCLREGNPTDMFGLATRLKPREKTPKSILSPTIPPKPNMPDSPKSQGLSLESETSAAPRSCG